MNKKKGRDTNIARDKLFQTPLLHIGIALTTTLFYNDFRAASNVGKCTPTTSTRPTPFHHAVYSPPFQVEGSQESHIELNVWKKGRGLTIRNQQSSDPPRHTAKEGVMEFRAIAQITCQQNRLPNVRHASLVPVM